MTLNSNEIKEYYIRKNFIFQTNNKKIYTEEQIKQINKIVENARKKINLRKVDYKKN